MVHEFERFRHYLAALASAQVTPRLRDRLDISGVVQETLLEAARDGSRVAIQTDAAQVGWLRKILAHNLTDAMRALRAGKRDVARERPLGDLLAQSSIRLGGWLVGGQPSPSSIVASHERAVRVADALARLPDAQQEALSLHYWHDRGLSQIATQMGRTPAAVAGLLKRGLRRLRVLLDGAKEQI